MTRPDVPPPNGPPPTSPLPPPPPPPPSSSSTSSGTTLPRSTSSPLVNNSSPLPPSSSKMAATKQNAPVSSSSSAPALATSRTNGKPTKKELDPAVYADLVQARINALEGVESAEDQAEKKSAIEARKAVKEATDHVSLEVKYMDLFQEMKRQERVHIQERSRFSKEKEAAKLNLSKATQGKTKLDSQVKDLTRHMKSLQDENKKLSDLVATARTEKIDSIKQEVASVRSRPGRPFPLPQPISSLASPSPPSQPSSSSNTTTITTNPASSTSTAVTLRISSILHGELFVKVLRNRPLERAFQTFATTVSPLPSSSHHPIASSSQNNNHNNKGKGKQQHKAPPPPPPSKAGADGVEFVFSHAGTVIEKESTPDELGLEERDEIWAVEFRDLGALLEAEEEEEAAALAAKEEEEAAGLATPLGGGGSKKKKKGGGGGGGGGAGGSNTPVSSASTVVAGSPSLGTLVLGGGGGGGGSGSRSAEEKTRAKAKLESIFESVVRERLKTVLRQYELRETQFEAVLRSKELEVLLSKARSEEARWLVEEADQKSRERENQTERYAKSLEELQRAQGQLLDKLVSLAQDDSKDQAARLFGFIREEIQKRKEGEGNAAAAPTSTTTNEGGGAGAGEEGREEQS
ncbi:hypothetical protein BDY24DRAFT_441855 [Mrakia frigida]|uniref:uncharacterized protein n=1 Tax=Mrakia frigida TaxID=29902 RepID=UPI003FCC0252